jgi:hypothetical protein
LGKKFLTYPWKGLLLIPFFKINYVFPNRLLFESRDRCYEFKNILAKKLEFFQQNTATYMGSFCQIALFF